MISWKVVIHCPEFCFFKYGNLYVHHFDYWESGISFSHEMSRMHVCCRKHFTGNCLLQQLCILAQHLSLHSALISPEHRRRSFVKKYVFTYLTSTDIKPNFRWLHHIDEWHRTSATSSNWRFSIKWWLDEM